MLTSSHFYIWGISVLCLFFVGCASTRLEEITSKVPPVPEVQESSSQTVETAADPVQSTDAGWQRVIYRGTVLNSEENSSPASGVRVSLMEGQDELCSAITDEKGKFRLVCDLYGKPGRDGDRFWMPESYYALVASDRSGRVTKRLLTEIDFDEPLILELPSKR